MTDLVPANQAPATERLENVEEVTLGQWYWHTYQKRGAPIYRDDDGDGEEEFIGYGPSTTERVLCCITYIGSNYIEATGPNGSSWRSHLINEFDQEYELATDAKLYIEGKVAHHQECVKELLDEVRRITVALGVGTHGALAAASVETQALAAAHGEADIQAHKTALVVAKDKTLPELFKEVEKHHESMVVWMKADLLPSKAQLGIMKQAIGSIEQRIFTVELYAGLVEKLELIRDGKPAADEAKIHLFQRRHYMDEECLAHYEAGGMEFADLADFEKWLMRDEHRTRILPFERSIVAFRVRRASKERYADSLAGWITIQKLEEADKLTFLYLRNGERVYRMSTQISFGADLFPDREHSETLGDTTQELYMHQEWNKPVIITKNRFDDLVETYKRAAATYEADLAVYKRWRKLPEDRERDRDSDEHVSTKGKTSRERAEYDIKRGWRGHFSPWGMWGPDQPKDPREKYEPLNQDSVYYDDAMRQIADDTREHNRVAVVLQGLLDRSPAFQPHPPWKIWTPEGFQRAIELVYDNSRAIAPGDEISFAAYRAELAKSIKVGSMVLGQEDYWMLIEGKKEQARRDRSWRSRSDREITRHKPYGNPGPGLITRVEKIITKRDKSQHAVFSWWRKRQREPRWNAHASEPRLPCSVTVPLSRLFNISAYTPGDFRLFYNDPRTRAKYLQWAPFLLTAEDFHAGKVRDGRIYCDGLEVEEPVSDDDDDDESETDDDEE